MAIDYVTLFADIGTFITAVDRFRDVAVGLNGARPDLPALEATHETALTASGRFEVLSGLDVIYQSFRNSAVGWSNTLSERVTARLMDQETVLDQLPGIPGATVDRVLPEIYRDMNGVFRVGSNTITIGLQSNSAGNQGNGTFLKTKRLDGVSRPNSRAPADWNYAGKNSQLVVPSESLTWTCTGDSFASGLAEGSERFLVETRPRQGGRFGWQTEGSGESVTVSCANNDNSQVANKDFEAWTNSTTPANWTVQTGTVTQETAAANVFRGVSSLRLDSGGKIRQTVSALAPRRMYICSVAFKTVSGTTVITMKMEGTGLATQTGEQIFTTTSGNTTWNQGALYFLAPDQPPSDLRLTIELTGAGYLDSVTFSPAVYIAGIGVNVVAGALPWTIGDRFSVSLANNDTGRIQRFWRRKYDRQLPSTGGTLIADPPV